MLVPLFLFTAIALSFYGVLVKLAARILHFTVTWKSSFLFAFLMLLIVLLSRAVFPPPDAVAVVIGQMFIMAIAFAGLGSWFFRKRITDAEGRILGWPGSIRSLCARPLAHFWLRCCCFYRRKNVFRRSALTCAVS